MGIGATELAVIVVAALVVFGAPALFGFWLGYQAGRKGGTSAPAEAAPADSSEENPTDD